MGQRHQIYLRTIDGSIVGIHHQWLYGLRSVKQLKNMLTYIDNAVKNDETFSFKYDAQSMLAACYSIDIESGYYHRVHKLDDNNPDNGDNNNGITLIDISDMDNPTYCFASIHGLERLDRSILEGDYQHKTPIDYKQWIYLHYPLAATTEYDEFFERYNVMTQQQLNSFFGN